MQHIIHQLQKEKKLRLLTSTIMIVFSAFMQCYIMNVFMAPCNLISGGFTGLALLINKVCALVNINFPTQVGIIALNVPAAILCYKHIFELCTILSSILLYFYLPFWTLLYRSNLKRSIWRLFMGLLHFPIPKGWRIYRRNGFHCPIRF